ncbi:MAG: beta-ketoacyl synthase N-terminal-like domain-containing protein [Planctomycetota bacterium]|nr:beta-ketoacyl synthase N-terminal-like domain-containing protein [Planctomycetota bacterium]
MSRRVLITGLGPITGLGAGIEPTWQRVLANATAIGPITSFDPAGFPCRIAAEVRDFKVSNHVPKSHRKSVKVMARDTELAVAAADMASRDAKLHTRGNVVEAPAASPGSPAAEPKLSYAPSRVGAHIGAGLIAAELNELTDALSHARDANGNFDIHKWGSEGMPQLTPLWLLKYLPNMLACHVTIIHDAQGPSNTITCGEASGALSIGESMRVIQRGAADACFCGGAESKLNPMAFLRQGLTGRLNTVDNDRPAQAVRPYAADAAGTVIGEGGAIVVIEDAETFRARAAAAASGGENDVPRAYATLLGFGASQTINPATRNLQPDAEGRGLALAIRAALREAAIDPSHIDLIVPVGLGVPEYDRAELAAIVRALGPKALDIPRVSVKPLAGNCGAGAGSLDFCVAAKAVAEQTLPVPGGKPAKIRAALVLSTSLGGQNAALVLGPAPG